MKVCCSPIDAEAMVAEIDSAVAVINSEFNSLPKRTAAAMLRLAHTLSAIRRQFVVPRSRIAFAKRK